MSLFSGAYLIYIIYISYIVSWTASVVERSDLKASDVPGGWAGPATRVGGFPTRPGRGTPRGEPAEP